MSALVQQLIVAALVLAALLFAVWRLAPASVRLQAVEFSARVLGGPRTSIGAALQRLAGRLRARYIQSGCANCGGGIKPRLK
jgi:hypothetical protein